MACPMNLYEFDYKYIFRTRKVIMDSLYILYIYYMR